MRRFLTLLACLLTAGLAMADRVSEREALKKAQAFMPGERFEMKKYASPEGGQTEEPPFYIFNVENGRGYVLVSAEDRTTAILGYSTNGNIDLANIPDNLRYWLDSYAAQLKAIDEGTPIAARAVAGDKAMTRGTRSNIAPLLKTTWNQDGPYNLMCPDGNFVDYDADGYDSNNRCVTGCVATALAQVMYYHKWPQQTTEIPAYTINYSNAPTLSLNELPTTTFEWNKMKTSYSNTETDDAAYAVAKLMRYAGQACQMAYGTGASSAHIHTDMMISAFGYSKNIHTKDRDGYTNTQWEDMVYDELANNRPVLYSGRTEGNSGHQFVCDGYKDGLFSLNWGWGGWLDGFFVLSIADPDGQQGIGGSTGAYKIGQGAVFNFMPAAANEEEVPMMISNIGTNTATANYTRFSASDDFTGISISCNYIAMYNYQPATIYDAEVGWGLYQGEQLIKCIGSFTKTIDYRDLSAGIYYIGWMNSLSNASFGAGLSDGKYQLRQIWRKANSSDDWELMDNYGIDYLVAEISENALTLRARNSSTESFTVNSISVPETMIEGEPVAVTVKITNEGETNQETVNLWSQKVGTSSWTKVTSMIGYVGPSETGDVVLTFTPEAGGSFNLKVTNNESDVALATKENITIFDVFQTTVDAINYSCITGLNVATVIAGDNYSSITNLVIPAKVTIDNVDYAVKAIRAGAFWNCNGFSKIILPRGLESIGDEAFAYCFGVTAIELPSSLKSIGDGAFMGEGSLTEVTSRILDPSDISDDTFTGMDFNTWTTIPSTATITVPKGTKSKYENCAGWSTIFHGRIEETNFANGDANGSGGDPTPSDAVDVISFLLGQTPDGFDAAAVDMNGDGVVTVTDIILLIITYKLIP